MNTSPSKQKYYVICVDDDADFLASLTDPLHRALDRLGADRDDAIGALDELVQA